MHDSDDQMDPAAALRLVRRSHEAAAVRAKAPRWYFPVTGALVGVQIASFQAPSPVTTMIGLFGTLASLLYYYRVTGVRLNGFTAGSLRARLIMISGVAVMMLFAVLALWLKRQPGTDAAITGVGVAAGLFFALAGLAWERVFRHDEGLRT